MIKFIKDGDIFQSQCDVLVNTVNTVGVCGKGLALLFKEKYPWNYQQYVKDCTRGFYKPGMVITFAPPLISDRPIIANFATKAHWRMPSKIEWIDQGLKQLADIVYTNGWSVAIPAVGCGNGGLNWNEQVRPLVWDYFHAYDVLIEVYEPSE